MERREPSERVDPDVGPAPDERRPRAERFQSERTERHREDRPREGRFREERFGRRDRDERREGGGRDYGRREDRRRDEPRPTPTPAAETAPPVLARPPAATSGQRVGILVDLEALQQEAQRAGGELAYRKLLRGVLGDRTLIRAICYVGTAPHSGAQALVASGFEIAPASDAAAMAMAMAVDAMAMASRIDVLVLAPGNRALPVLVHALRGLGIRVEAAGFEGDAPADTIGRRLGRECVFVP